MPDYKSTVGTVALFIIYRFWIVSSTMSLCCVYVDGKDQLICLNNIVQMSSWSFCGNYIILMDDGSCVGWRQYDWIVYMRRWMRGHWLLYISQEFVHANSIIQCQRKFGVRNISSKSIYGFNAMPIVQRVILWHTNVVDAVVHIHTVYTVHCCRNFQVRTHTHTHVCRGVNYEMVSQNCNTGRVGRRRHHHHHVGHLFNVHSFNRCTDVSHFSPCLNIECIFQHLFHHLMLIQCGFDLQCSSRIIRMYIITTLPHFVISIHFERQCNPICVQRQRNIEGCAGEIHTIYD